MQAGQEAAPLQGLRVMIVEDELLLAMELEERLQEEGCTVIGPAARTGKAMDLLLNERPDAVVLDLNLHGERPTALAEAMVARRVPFVVVSGYVGRQMDESALDNAPRVGKPFRSDELLRVLARTVAAQAA